MSRFPSQISDLASRYNLKDSPFAIPHSPDQIWEYEFASETGDPGSPASAENTRPKHSGVMSCEPCDLKRRSLVVLWGRRLKLAHVLSLVLACHSVNWEVRQ